MQIHKINATPSTNSYLKELVKEFTPKEDVVVVTDNQTHGRGQREAIWKSKQGQSLTFSVFKELNKFDISKQFYVSMVVSLAIKKMLIENNIQSVNIKWPNDILSANKKICGILIENIIQQSHIKGSIIGIGLNVNETSFDFLPNATSMKLRAGLDFGLEEIMHTILKNLDFYFSFLKEKRYSELKQEYLSEQYRINTISCFQYENGVQFNGIIRDVAEDGKLKIEMAENKFAYFESKEIRLLY